MNLVRELFSFRLGRCGCSCIETADAVTIGSNGIDEPAVFYLQEQGNVLKMQDVDATHPSLNGTILLPHLEAPQQHPPVDVEAPAVLEDRTFDVQLTRAGEHWRTVGLSVNTRVFPNALLVDGVNSPSLVSAWNANHDPCFNVRKGDRIVSVAGRSLPGRELLNLLQDAQEGQLVNFKVAARSPFDMEITRVGANAKVLGILVSPDDDPNFLVVDEIREPSLVGDWIQTHISSQAIRVGDRITKVNDLALSSEEMLERLQQLGVGATIRLRVES